MRAAVEARRDLRRGALDEEAHEEALRAAEAAHSACLQQRSRRGGCEGAQSRASVTAYYNAVSAATAALKRAVPPPKAARAGRAAMAEEEDDDEDDADIERERKRNIKRNKACLVSLGLA